MKINESKKIKHNHTLLMIVLGVYILILFAFLFLKARSFQSVSLIPFRTITDYLSYGGFLSFINVLGNIVLFIPLGIYLMFFNHNKRICLNTLWVVLISMAVEILQYVFKVGATDIDDIILNGLGGFLGIMIYKILRKIFKDKVGYAIELASLIVGITFLILNICLSSGVFGIKIRIL
mgnify:CR=1 FL=1